VGLSFFLLAGVFYVPAQRKHSEAGWLGGSVFLYVGVWFSVQLSLVCMDSGVGIDWVEKISKQDWGVFLGSFFSFAPIFLWEMTTWWFFSGVFTTP